MESLALSPLETNNLEALRKPDGGFFDWNYAFKRFDHRRFVSFGLVHGLLVRIHNYPYFPGDFPDRETLWEATGTLDSKHDLKDEKTFQLARKVASCMDGTRCDDELVCLFQKPFAQLSDLVETFGRRKIVSVYAAAPGN